MRSTDYDRTFAMLAIGEELDRMARFYDCPRRVESDAELRTRLLMAIEAHRTPVTGAKSSYRTEPQPAFRGLNPRIRGLRSETARDANR
jgi:hypothetical protein